MPQRGRLAKREYQLALVKPAAGSRRFEERDQRLMTRTPGEVERRVALLVAHAEVGPRGEQVFDDLEMSRSRRAHQRRSTVETPTVYGATARKQDHDDVGVAGFGCDH